SSTSSPTSASSTSSSSTTTGSTSSSSGDAGPGCGYQGLGTPLQVAPGIEVLPPQVVCTSETCPPPLGQCVAGKCQFSGAYNGVQTLPEAWATHYCALSTGGCH